jgi:hypothetical protein
MSIANWNTPAVIVIAALAFGGYKAIAATSESARLTVAKDACVKFAKERDVFPAGDKVEAMDAWTKHDGRYAVVALANPSGQKFDTKLCVSSKYSLHIPGGFAEAAWY